MPESSLPTPSTLARDEGYWQRIAAQYDVEPGPVNLEQGYFGRMTRHVADTYQAHIAAINRANSLPVREDFDRLGNLQIRAAAAELLHAPASSVAITQSASASMQSLIRNYTGLKAGDQVLLSDLEYDSVSNAIRWLARQRGAEVIELRLPHPASYDNLLQSYRDAFIRHPRLKLMPLTYVTHRTGLVMPVQAITALAREHGIEVFLDGAHALGQIDFRLDQLGIEFAGFNLQKWIGAPLSLGLIYIAPGRMGDIEPDMADDRFPLDDARSRAPYGTPNIPAWLTLPTVFSEHAAIGTAAKGARLNYLRDLWVNQARDIEGIEVLVPDDPRLYCGITSFRFTRHRDQAHMAQRLLNEFNLFTVARDGAACGPCIRVTPGFTTTPAEVQQLVEALRQLGR